MEIHTRLDSDTFQKFAQNLAIVAEAKNLDPLMLITIYYLTSVRKMKSSEVAELLGLTRGTVNTYSSLVRRAIRNTLNNSGNAEKMKEVEKQEEVKKPTSKSGGTQPKRVSLVELAKRSRQKVSDAHG